MIIPKEKIDVNNTNKILHSIVDSTETKPTFNTKFNNYINTFLSLIKDTRLFGFSVVISNLKSGYTKVIANKSHESGIVEMTDNTPNQEKYIKVFPNGCFEVVDDKGNVMYKAKAKHIIFGNETTIDSVGLTVVSGDTVTIKTSDTNMALWKPNTIPICPFTGLSHCVITKLKGETKV